MFKNKGIIKIRVHHALNFAQWVKDGRSDDDIRAFLKSNNYDEPTIETSVLILQKFRDPSQKIRVLGYRDVSRDEVCRSCTLQRGVQKCDLPPQKGFADNDETEAYRYDLYPSMFPTTSKEIQQLRPRPRGFFR